MPGPMRARRETRERGGEGWLGQNGSSIPALRVEERWRKRVIRPRGTRDRRGVDGREEAVPLMAIAVSGARVGGRDGGSWTGDEAGLVVAAILVLCRVEIEKSRRGSERSRLAKQNHFPIP